MEHEKVTHWWFSICEIWFEGLRIELLAVNWKVKTFNPVYFHLNNRIVGNYSSAVICWSALVLFFQQGIYTCVVYNTFRISVINIKNTDIQINTTSRELEECYALLIIAFCRVIGLTTWSTGQILVVIFTSCVCSMFLLMMQYSTSFFCHHSLYKNSEKMFSNGCKFARFIL